MLDPAIPNRLPAVEAEAVHRLTARLATLDLDPSTLEILTAILTADIDVRDGDEEYDTVEAAS